MTRYVWGNGDWIDTTGWKRPPRKTPYIVRDSMTPAVHPVTGDVLDSKSASRAITREHVERLGKNHGIPAKRVAAAIDDVRAALADWPSHARDMGVRMSVATVSEGLDAVARQFG